MNLRKWTLLLGALCVFVGTQAQEKVTTESGAKSDFIYKNGNVGIGTISPSQRLVVGPDLGSFTPCNAIVLTDPNSPSLVIGSDQSNNVWLNYTKSTGSFIINARRNNLVYENIITVSEGNLGIGTTDTKGYKLAVAGNTAIQGILKAQEIEVQTDVWADFVFKPDYKLRPLSEVESFIQENKHLPDIPSEAEVKKEGIALSEMNTRFLQKIEELMLYAIELKKENEVQSSKLGVQSMEIQDIRTKNQELEKEIKLIKELLKK